MISKMRFTLFLMVWVVGIIFVFPSAHANNLSIQNVQLTGRNTTDHYVMVQFDISWENSWRDAVNYDGAWVFIKYKKTGLGWHHATLHTSGHSAPSGANIEVGTTNGVGKGVFIYRSSEGSGDVNWSSVQLRWDYGSDGLADNDLVTVKVFGIEMVYVPQGAFYVGDTPGGNAVNNFYEYGTSNDPYLIDSEDAIDVGTTNGNLYYHNNGGSPGDFSGPIPADFPKGYDAFWCMKYEITQGQYTDFLNTLTRTQQNQRTETDISTSSISDIYVMSGRSSEIYRNTIKCPSSGNGTSSPITFSVDAPDLACNYLSFEDVKAYLDWAALRPLTELEFEKACRGPEYPVLNEMAHGNGNGGAITGFEGVDKSGTETKSPTTGLINKAYGNQSGVQGPVRVGIFAATDNGQGYTRENAGASYWGIMELSGNVVERCVTVGNTYGRAYTGLTGDGELNSSGNSDVTNWPPSGYGQSYRGGSWSRDLAECMVGYRLYGSINNTARGSDMGGRGCR